MTMPTSHPRTKKSGFTLIEILLVVTLIALLSSIVAPGITGVFRVGLQSSLRRYSAIVKYAYDQAVVTGSIHRIVIDMDEQAWSVEKANPGELPIDPTRFGLLPESLNDDDRVTKEAAFSPVGQRYIETLPAGVKILEFASWRLGDDTIVQEGKVNVYAYPSGFIDEATVVFVEDGEEDKQKFLVTIKSLTGRVDIETENSPL